MLKERTLLRRELPNKWATIQGGDLRRYVCRELRIAVAECITADDLSNLPRKNVHLLIQSQLTRPHIKDIEEVIDIFIGQTMYLRAAKIEILCDDRHDFKCLDAWFTFDETTLKEYIESSREERKL